VIDLNHVNELISIRDAFGGMSNDLGLDDRKATIQVEFGDLIDEFCKKIIKRFRLKYIIFLFWIHYSLDCKEGHMKNIRLSVCIGVKRTSI